MGGEDSIVIRILVAGAGERPCGREFGSGGENGFHCVVQSNIFSFFRIAAENPNLDPKGNISGEVFASAYTAAIEPRIL